MACGFSWDALDVARFLSKCVWERHITWDNKLNICLNFTGAMSSGGASYDKKNNKKRGKNRAKYGSFTTKGKTVRAHKFYAVAVLGLRPGPGDELDHLCYNTRCVSCLECVPRAVNQARIRKRGKASAEARGGEQSGRSGATRASNPCAPAVPPARNDA